MIHGFSDEMTNVGGNQIRFHESKFAPHDIPLSNDLLHMDTELQAAVKDAHAFFED